jgi:hypothetical protein
MAWNRGNQQFQFPLQDMMNREIQSPFTASNWILYALRRQPMSRKWYNHFIAVPYNSYGIGPLHFPLSYSPEQQSHAMFLVPTGPTGISPMFYSGNYVAGDPVLQKGLNKPKVSDGSNNLAGHINVSSSVVKATKPTKSKFVSNAGYLSPIAQQDIRYRQSLGDENEISILPEFCKYEKKSGELKSISLEDDNGLAFIQKKNEECKHNPNPNGRGRASSDSSVLSDLSRTTSFETKEPEFEKDTDTMSFHDQVAVSDKMLKYSRESTQEIFSDSTTDSDFLLVSQGSAESESQFRVSLMPVDSSIRTSALPSKQSVLKSWPVALLERTFFSQSESDSHTVSRRKKRWTHNVIVK